jgi:hypothetical protein
MGWQLRLDDFEKKPFGAKRFTAKNGIELTSLTLHFAELD